MTRAAAGRNMSGTDLVALRTLLSAVPAGKLDDAAESDILTLLRACWSSLTADATRMTSDKLFRAEDLTWNPPILSFQVERHGAAALGSTFGEIQGWEINVESGDVRPSIIGRRQIAPRAPSLDVGLIASRVSEAVQAGPNLPLPESLKETVEWKAPDELVVRQALLVPARGPKQTIASRRLRFRKALVKQLKSQGWNLVSLHHTMTFKRDN
jgi:hypothetical protein